jgi:hypothetical protein
MFQLFIFHIAVFFIFLDMTFFVCYYQLCICFNATKGSNIFSLILSAIKLLIWNFLTIKQLLLSYQQLKLEKKYVIACMEIKETPVDNAINLLYGITVLKLLLITKNCQRALDANMSYIIEELLLILRWLRLRT